MKTEFEANFSEASAALGFISGITKTVKTDAYIADVLTYTHSRMSQEVDEYIDNIARAAPNMLHHMYEWPTGWDDSGGNTKRGGSPRWSETVGAAPYRLWRHTLVGRGASKTAGYTFLPSNKPSPVNPKLVQAGVKENVHVFVWKAPTMEAGAHIEVGRKLAKTLAFIDKEGNVRFAQNVDTGPAGGGATTGRFTATYLSWWSSQADAFFSREIAPELGRNINPEGVLGRAAVRIGTRTRTKSFEIGVRQAAQAEKEAQNWVMRKAKENYINAAASRREALYGS